MKMRLIDADLLKENISKWLKTSKPDETETIEIADAIVSTMMEIDEQPTAYDVDKVINCLEQEKTKAKANLMEDAGTGFEFSSKCRLNAYLNAIRIVKGGAE